MIEKSSNFVSTVNKLKRIPRSGWISHGVRLQDVESVAEHTFCTSTIAMLIADAEIRRGRRINVERVLRMALLHDLAEALTFDISKSYLRYLGKKGEAMNEQLERAAWNHIAKSVNLTSARRHYTQLQSEYESEETIESQIVHAADKLDLLFQIVEYIHKGYARSMFADLWVNTNRVLKRDKLLSVQNLHEFVLKLYSTGDVRPR